MALTGSTALVTANLYFQLITCPSFEIGDRSTANRLRALQRLCELGSTSHRAIAPAYFEMCQQPLLHNSKTDWLKDAAWCGSSFALRALKHEHPVEFEEWKREVEDTASSSQDEGHLLLSYCRTGNFLQCHRLLDGRASALSDWDEPGPLHYLAMHCEPEVPLLANRLLDAGAALDHFEGSELDDDFLLGRHSGTPLHWAVVNRNVPLIEVLTERDPDPLEGNVKGAFFIACYLHFPEVLEILWNWVTSVKCRLRDDYVAALQMVAAYNVESHLPRCLWHGHNVDTAMSQTFEILFLMGPPSESSLTSTGGLLNIGTIQHHTSFVQYLLHKFAIPTSLKIPEEVKLGIITMTVLAGHFDLFLLFCRQNILNPNERFGTEKFTGIQICLAAHQRNPAFYQHFIDWGCWVDEMGDTTVSEWTPFGMAVQCGLYEIATLLLRNGADKDITYGWLGGTTSLFKLLHTWPDIPISRVKYFLEDLPRQGFCHVSWFGWPACGASILYALSMAVWSHYRNSYKFAETMKYILSMVGDKSCINQLDRYGCTALNQAARAGNLEVVRVLIHAGADVNGGLAISPLDAAIEWRDKWVEKEKQALGRKVVAERRHAMNVRVRAEELVWLLRSHGARERGFKENQQMMLSTVASGNFRLPSMEVSVNLCNKAFLTVVDVV